MIILEQIATYLDNQSAELTFSKTTATGNILIHDINDLDNQMGLFKVGGDPNQYQGGYDIVEFQMIWKGTSNPITTEEKALTYAKIINEFYNSVMVVGQNYILDCHWLNQPEFLQVDETGRFEFQTRFKIHYKER